MLASAIRNSSSQKTRFINSKQLANHTANYSGLQRADVEQLNRKSSKNNQQDQFTFVVTKEIPLNSKQLQSASSNDYWSIIQSELQSICASNEYNLLQSPDIILLDKEWIKGPLVPNCLFNVNRNIHGWHFFRERKRPLILRIRKKSFTELTMDQRTKVFYNL